jgi:regulator of sigma E protease
MFSDTNVQTWDELVALIEENPGKKVSISFLRNGNLIDSDTTLESRTINTQQVGYLGVTPTIENQKIGLITAVKSTTILEAQMTIAAVDGIITLFSPENIKTLLGTYSGQTIPDEVRPLSPIGLAQAGNQIAEDSYVNLFSLLAFVNIFLAVFNALPFIPLDGGRVVLAIVEGVTGKKVSDKKLYPIAALVVGVFIFLGITAFYLDITQPIRL